MNILEIAKTILDQPRMMAAFIVVMSIAALLFALISQYGFGYPPCVLCIYQRIPYLFAIAFGLIAYGVHPFGKARFLSLMLMTALALFVTAGIAAYHTGVEQQWWAGTAECGRDLPVGGSVEELRAALLNAPVTRCDVVSWSFLGISMAAYNFLFALALGLLTLRSGFQAMRR